MECIVLAGGLGTRLQGVIGAMPKCMALVAGHPFLHHVFHYLSAQQCTRVILSLGYKHEMVLEWLEDYSWPFAIDYVIEEEPLGTGGGISLAAEKIRTSDFFVLNGDTMFRAALPEMMLLHQRKSAEATLALKHMTAFERYGVVRIDENGRILSFEEKKYYDAGLINGGVYIINKTRFKERQLPEKYSFEKDYLEQHVQQGHFFGYACEGYFIDIGVPEDYERAQSDFAR